MSQGSEILAYGPTAGFARTAEPLLWYSGAARERRTGPHYHHDARLRHETPHAVIQLTLEGLGYYRRTDGPQILLPAGRAFIDWIPGPFEYGWVDDAVTHIYDQVFVSMQGEVVMQLTQQIHQSYGPVVDFGTDRSVAETMLAIVNSGHSRSFRDRYVVSGQLYGLFMQILSVLSRSRVAARPIAENAIKLIELHVGDHTLTVSTLARSLDCSREHLAREFRKATGMSPMDYLTQHRVRLVAAALREGNSKLESLAGNCGFSSVGYLCRVFKRTVGVTPTQFRERPWLVAP